MSLHTLDQRDLDTHVRMLGWVHIGGEMISVAIGLFAFMFFFGIGLAVGTEDPEAFPILATLGTVACGLIAVLAIPGIVAGIGLLKRRPWSRPLALMVGFLDLLAFPFGTAIGLYTFYVLLQREAPAYFEEARYAEELASDMYDEYDDYDDDVFEDGVRDDELDPNDPPYDNVD